MARRTLVTGSAGFIGSAVVRHLVRHTAHKVDKLTYAGNLESLAEASASPRYRFYQIDICDAAALDKAFTEFRPHAVMHLADESHVDRSIDGRPTSFGPTSSAPTRCWRRTATMCRWRWRTGRGALT